MLHIRALFLKILLVLLPALLLSACSSNGPRQIAAYPKTAPQGPVQIYPHLEQIVYRAEMDVTVADVDQAARKAESFASQYSGYLSSSNSFLQDGQRFTTVVLSVPSGNYTGLHDALLKLGTLTDEQVSGDLVPYGPGEISYYSTITVNFSPDAWHLPPISFGSWHPLQTLEKALDFSASIFGFLLDILIWLVVVLGPFLLLGWLALVLIRRSRRARLL